MKIAVVSDVHANFPALQAVLTHARQQGVREFWDLGDSVGYNPFPNEVVNLFRQHQVKSILGNYDQKVLAFPVLQKKWRTQKAPAKYFSFRWACRSLSERNKKYLKALPVSRRISRQGIRFLLVHASPLDIDEIVGPRTSIKRLKVLAKATRADIVLFGHSHYRWDKTIMKTRFLNPGSVGRSFNGKQKASYMILDVHRGRVDAQHFCLAYDVRQNLDVMRTKKFPSLLIDSIRLGRSIDELEKRRRS